MFSRRKETNRHGPASALPVKPGTFCSPDQSRPQFDLPLDHSIAQHDIQVAENNVPSPGHRVFLAPIERLRFCFRGRLWNSRHRSWSASSARFHAFKSSGVVRFGTSRWLHKSIKLSDILSWHRSHHLLQAGCFPAPRAHERLAFQRVLKCSAFLAYAIETMVFAFWNTLFHFSSHRCRVGIRFTHLSFHDVVSRRLQALRDWVLQEMKL